jgi:hypothetical protein
LMSEATKPYEFAEAVIDTARQLAFHWLFSYELSADINI